MKPSLVVVVVLGCVVHAVQSVRWTSTIQDGQELFLCVGANITLPWQYELSPEEELLNIQWTHKDGSEELVAMLAANSFLPLPSYGGGRVEAVNNAGIVLQQTTPSDSGNYTVEVHVTDHSGNHDVLRQTVVVHIRDDLILQDGQVQVQQTPEAVLNRDTDQWSIQLTCGVFHFHGSPLFSVEWVTPDGTIHNTNDYVDGSSHFLLSMPIKGGNYTCRVPFDHLGDVCIHGDTSQRGEATLFVDKLETRLTLVEKENERLKTISEIRFSQLEQLERENSLLKNSTNAKFSQLELDNEHLRNENNQLRNDTDARISQLATENEQLREENGRLKNSTDVRFAQVQSDAQQLQTEIQQLESRTQQMNTKTEQLDTKTEQLQTEAQQLQTDTQHLQRDSQQLQTDTQQLQAAAQQLRTDTSQLQNDTSRLQTDTHQLQTQTQQLQRDTQHLTTDSQQLQADSQQLTQRVDTIEDEARRLVSFQATGSGLYATPPSGKPLVFDHVVTNQGNAYNRTTGYFTAPYPGTYFFAATSGTVATEDVVHFDLFVGTTLIDRTKADSGSGPNTFSTLHGIVHLSAGQTVLVRSHGEMYYLMYSTFTGFLISPDP